METPNCLIVDSGRARTLDLDIHMPQLELGPIASHELWAETLDTIAEMTGRHGTTLVFVNTRRLVERVSHQLSVRLGEEAVAAHHGSLSRSTRLAAEDKLRSGKAKVCVATASLELGIDIGFVDLVCQIGSPRSINLLLQRVGRSGHMVGGRPKGRLFSADSGRACGMRRFSPGRAQRRSGTGSRYRLGRWIFWHSR